VVRRVGEADGEGQGRRRVGGTGGGLRMVEREDSAGDGGSWPLGRGTRSRAESSE